MKIRSFILLCCQNQHVDFLVSKISASEPPLVRKAGIEVIQGCDIDANEVVRALCGALSDTWWYIRLLAAKKLIALGSTLQIVRVCDVVFFSFCSLPCASPLLSSAPSPLCLSIIITSTTLMLIFFLCFFLSFFLNCTRNYHSTHLSVPYARNFLNTFVLC